MSTVFPVQLHNTYLPVGVVLTPEFYNRFVLQLISLAGVHSNAVTTGTLQFILYVLS